MILKKIKKNISLKNYTTLRIGGRAKFFLVANKKEDFLEGIKWAKEKKKKIFVLGGGSNLLVSDRGFDGLVMKNEYSGIEREKNFLRVKSGEKLSFVLNFCLLNSLSGLEWAVGIPGTIGGAVFGNAGAFGFSIGDLVEEVEVLDLNDLKIKKLPKRKIWFSYRDSFFKKKKNYIVLEVLLKLKKGRKKKIKEKIEAFLKKKKESQPLGFFSAGCVFKNPKGISAGKLVEKLGFNGKKIGKIMVSLKHANFFLNLGGGKAKDFLKLIKEVKKEAKKRFKIDLKEEIILLD
jgi:UDP-N-acetylmuramate dehydrogenase